MTIDEKLVQQITKGKHDLFGELIDRYEKQLSVYICRIINDSDNCQDILQEVFIKAYKNLNSFDPKRKFSSWIYRIAHNEAISFIRKNRLKVSFEDMAELDNGQDLEKEIQQKFDTVSINNTLAKAVKTLTIKYREIVILRYFENKSYEEISEIMHMPVSTVGTYLIRAKAKLKKNFKDIDLEEIL